MHLVRYTEWDGTQRVRLSAEKVFEKLAEYLSYTDDVQQAFDWLLRHGLELEGMRIMGVDDFLEALREAMRERQRQFNLDRSLDPIAERLEELLDLERDTLDAARRRDGAGEARAARPPAAPALRSDRAVARATSSRTATRAPSSSACSRSWRTSAPWRTSSAATASCSRVRRRSTTRPRST